MQGRILSLRHPRLMGVVISSTLLGFGFLCGGCDGPSGSGGGGAGEEVPVGIEKLKESMKERAAAKKGRPGGLKGMPAGR